ncbi:ash family protein [Klebsiella pneumoniae]|uniref:ash family protein n=1 Tax=Klebsiella pneumoniae TaxID=573 RepID=UPI000BA5E7FC|nr:ash family protein [Klebsiella pneumoniae]EME1440177.1 ash family protein [Klebsiella pneumoniae]PAC64624.1 HAD family hydrolase [Klebsiella pneumoniae]TWX85525.1 HAD family hydrolase [Klebsiella pneumoniae]HBU0105407.1 ash family protein [Klebsiella pneumoniae]
MITGAQRKSLSLAGLMYAKVNALQAVRHRGNLSKPVTLRATDSGVQNAWQSFETITPAGKRSETDYLEDSASVAGGGCGTHHTASYKLPHRDKKGLRSEGIPVYGYSAPAKSGAGIGVLVIRMATHDAPSVFFCAVSLTHPFFERWDIIQRLARAMVAQAGASSEAPVSIRAGYANPAWATTSEIGVSGGSVTRYRMEAAAWLLPSPKFRNLSGLSPLFAAICRQLPQKFTISPHLLSAKPAVLWFGITSAFSLAVSVWRWLMLKTYDVPVNPTERTHHLISLAELMRDVLDSKADSREDYLEALIAMLEMSLRDLHGLLEGNELPEVRHA